MEKISTEKLISDIINGLMTMVDEPIRIHEIKMILEMHLGRVQVYTEDTAVSVQLDCNMEYLAKYLLNMKLNGNTDGSIRAYRSELKNVLAYIDKPIGDMTIQDLRSYLAHGKISRKWGDRTYNTKLIMIRGFFSWLYEEDLIEQNPAKKLKEAKVERRIGATLTPEQREIVRCSCQDERELAICDLLYTSGIRVSELCGLNRQDVDFLNMKAVVYGKGRKEREVYFNGQAKVHLQKYLESRTDNNEALFVWKRHPFSRLTANGVRNALHSVQQADTKIQGLKLTPHTYRRSLGTDMINRGAPVELVKEVLGHVRMDTTLQCYASISRETVKQAHLKYTA